MSHLTICIVNWNTRDYLRETLASIAAYPAKVETEVIVVDNASSDGSADMVRTEFAWAQLIHNSDNCGYAEANNQALAAAKGEWLLLLNPDVRLLPKTLDSALETARELPDFGALGVKQIGSDGRIQRSLRSFPDPIGVFFEIIGFSKVFPWSKNFASYRMNWFNYTGTIEVDQPMATFLLTNRSVYETVGGLDPAFPIFFNDVDWCYRVKETGKRIYYTDRAEIVHYGGAGTSKANKAAMAAESKRSFLRFYEKHFRNRLPGPLYALSTFAVRTSLSLQKLKQVFR